jgi:hypothetical protein
MLLRNQTEEAAGEHHGAMPGAGASSGDSLMLTCVPSTGAGK